MGFLRDLKTFNIEDLRYACKNHHLLITKHMTLRCEERKFSSCCCKL